VKTRKRELHDVVLTLHRLDGTRYVNMTSAAIIVLEGIDFVVASCALSRFD
jgi:hypothetical protein